MKEDILTLDQIYLNVEEDTKLACLQFLANKAAEHHLGKDPNVILQGLLAREKESSTGFVEGFAIPHTRDKGIDKAGIIVMKSTHGIEWESMDDMPARFFIALFVPESDNGNMHITLLSKLARKLMDHDFKQQLLQVEDQGEIFRIIQSAIQA